MQNFSDSALVQRCVNGDRGAWDKFVERFSSLIYWAIKKTLNRTNYSYTPQDLEDIFQNVFCLLWEKGKLQQIRDRESIKSWLVMVAANCAHNFFRNKRESLIEDEPVLEKVEPADCSTGEVIHQERIKDILEDAFCFLPARERIVLKLNYIYDKTHQEIGEILRMPANSVSSIIKRAKEKLKTRLEKENL